MFTGKFPIVLVLLLFTVGVAAQGGKESWGLRGKVRYIETYETYFCCTPNERRQLPRRMTGAATFSRDGSFRESILITNTSDGPYYERTVFIYRKDLNKVVSETFKSERNPPDTYFTISADIDGKIVIEPRRQEQLKERSEFIKDERGNLIERIDSDEKGNTVRKYVYTFDKKGKIIRGTLLAANGSIENQYLISYTDGGRNSETLSVRPGATWTVHRSTVEKDSKGRVSRGESFGYSLDPSKGHREVLLSRSMVVYKGRLERRLDWRIFDKNGVPEKKLLILDNHRGDEISREEFNAGPLPAGSQNEDIEPQWTFAERTINHDGYDSRGNSLITKRYQQCGADLPLELTNIYERTILYY